VPALPPCLDVAKQGGGVSGEYYLSTRHDDKYKIYFDYAGGGTM